MGKEVTIVRHEDEITNDFEKARGMKVYKLQGLAE